MRMWISVTNLMFRPTAGELDYQCFEARICRRGQRHKYTLTTEPVRSITKIPLPIHLLNSGLPALSLFSGGGLSDFGYDSAAAVGFGKGSFGHGWFGLDADTIEWTSLPLEAGIYKFAVVVSDEKENQSSVSETAPVTVIPAAEPADGLKICSFDKQTNELVLKIA